MLVKITQTQTVNLSQVFSIIVNIDGFKRPVVSFSSSNIVSQQNEIYSAEETVKFESLTEAQDWHDAFMHRLSTFHTPVNVFFLDLTKEKLGPCKTCKAPIFYKENNHVFRQFCSSTCVDEYKEEVA